MKIKLAPSLLLSILSCSNDGASAFSSVQPTARSMTAAADASHRQPVALSMSNDFDTDYNVDVDRRGNISNISSSETNRRDILARLAATAAASAFLGGDAAFAKAPAKDTEFSESPTSEASIARLAYEKKEKGAPAEEESPAPAPAEAAAPIAEAKKSSDFDGNEAGPVGPGDEGSQPSDKKVTPSAAAIKSSVPILNLPNAYGDPKVLGAGAVALVGLAAISAGNEESYEPPAEGEKPSWQLNTPTPYGIANPDAKNPFITEVLEYCEGGKVTEDCAQTIKGYLDNVSETGAVATSSEVNAIVGYLDTLGSDPPTSPNKKKAGAAFTSYLDALSGGSAPPPSSAKAVKTYLDTLVVTGSSGKPAERKPMSSPILTAAPTEPEPVAEVPEPTPEPVAPTPDFSEYDNRLTNIEGRVTSLETKVDALPDKVFEKIEAWQAQHEERLTSEVKKIIETMTPPPAAEAPEPVAAVPAPVVAEPVPEPEPVVVEPVPEPEPAAPVVTFTPLAGAIPSRGMPQPTGGPKKRYGFGGGAAWKSNEPVAAVPEPMAAAPEPVAAAPEPVSIPEPEPAAAPAVPFTPLAGTIPSRGMPQPSAGGPKKGFGFGSGASWKK